MDENINRLLYIGTSNIVLPVANKLAYPEAYRNTSRLTYYASLFNSLEINSSFYKLPLFKTVVRWTTEVPGDFRFTFKMNRDITHDKLQVCNQPFIQKFMQTINSAGNKKGCLLVQFPGSMQCNAVYLKQLLALIQKDNQGWSVCVEFRHPSWYSSSVYSLLEKYSVGMVMHDMPKSATPFEDPWTNFVYLRFHGPQGDYKDAYDIDVLEKYAALIKGWLQIGKTVYAYFNNTIGNAVFDALALQELVTGRNTYAP